MATKWLCTINFRNVQAAKAKELVPIGPRELQEKLAGLPTVGDAHAVQQ